MSDFDNFTSADSASEEAFQRQCGMFFDFASYVPNISDLNVAGLDQSHR